ncbi:FecR domain-containing protein [Magnetovibrio sp.]|uniref:FecR domain-containing protein n=1 Tax=Magnetovibrio sp. TaxID=2024836 RepID=UPI002F9578C9
MKLLTGDGDAPVLLPANGDFLRADFSRLGPDLRIESPSGEAYVLPAFFMSESSPDLITHDGAVLNAALVATLAGPMAPAQVAQLGQGAVTAEVGLGQPIGQVSDSEGSVTVTHPDGSQATLATGDKIFQGDVVQTGTASNISIIFVDDTIFTLDESGRMVMDEMVYDPDTQTGAFNTTVVQGVFSFVSGQVAKTSPDGMVVSTPTSTIGIRGSTVVGKAAAEGAENKITLIKDVDGNVGEIIISNAVGSLTLNSAGASTTVFSATLAPTPIVILSPTELQQTFGQNLTKLIQTVSNKAKQDASQAESKAQETQQEAKQAEAEAKLAADEAQQAEDEAAQAQAEAEAAAAEAAAAKAEAEASGDEVAAAKAAAAEAKAAEAAQKAAEAKAAAEAEAQIAAKAQAEAQAKAGEAEAAQAKAEQAQKFSSLADSAFKAQAQAFEQNKQTEAEKAAKAEKADTTTDKADTADDGATKGQSSDDAATKAAAEAATQAAIEAAAKAAAEAEAAAKAAAEAAAKAAAEAAARAAELAAEAAAEDKTPTPEETSPVTTPTTSYSYTDHAYAVTVVFNGSTATVTDAYGLNTTHSNVKSFTGTSYNDTFTLSGVTLDKLSVGSGTDTITVDATTRITTLSNRPAHENTLKTLGNDGTSGDMDLRGTTVSGDFLITLNTQGNTDSSTILKVDSSTNFTSGSTTISIGQNSNARNIESDDGMNLSGVSFTGLNAVILDSSSDTVGAALTVTSASSFSGIAITGSGDDKIVFNDSGTFSFHNNTVTGIANFTFNGTGTNSLQVNQADLASVTTITGNTGSDTITTADSSLDLSAITLTSINLITTTNTTRTTFKGSAGNDTITGGSGSDVIAGGVGSDTLTGGTGGDVFAYQTLSNQGVDNLVDYTISQGDRIYIEKSVIGNKDTTFDAGEWFNLGTKADDASIQAAINAQSHVAGAIFGVYNSSTGHAEAWYDVTDHTTTGDANKVAYLGAYSQAVTNAATNPTNLGIVLADTSDLSVLNLG